MKLTKIKVRNMQNSKGNNVPNQFIITCGRKTYFQSYDSIIAIINRDDEQTEIILDEGKWDYSVTTGKYRNYFLGESITETRKKIKNGEYTLADLN